MVSGSTSRTRFDQNPMNIAPLATAQMPRIPAARGVASTQNPRVLHQKTGAPQQLGAKFKTLLALALLTLTFSQAKADDKGFAWQEPAEDHIDLTYDGRPALRYMMPTLDESSEEARNATFKPYHHVFSPDGKTLLTKGPGGLFPHHRGIFYGFNNITYGEGKKCDTWHCTGKTYQSHEQEIYHEVHDNSASHVVLIDWHGAEGEVFAIEERQVSVERAKRHGVEGWLIDIHSTLSTADGLPIHLDGDPQHAGMQFRATQEVPDKTAKETYYLRPDGPGKPGEYRNWDHKNPDAPGNKQSTDLPWNALCFVVDGQRFTVLYMASPDNPRPAHYSERDYGRFGSYFVADVTAEKPLTVNYRFWVQAGEMTVDQAKALYDNYIAPPAPAPPADSGTN